MKKYKNTGKSQNGTFLTTFFHYDQKMHFKLKILHLECHFWIPGQILDKKTYS